MKNIFMCLCILSATAATQAQTLRIKSNSVDNLHMVAMGTDRDGNHVTKTLYDVSYGYRKALNLYQVKYGTKGYSASDVEHASADAGSKWQKLVVYNNSTAQYDTLNLAERAKNQILPYAGLRARVSFTWERDYVITDVVLDDEN